MEWGDIEAVLEEYQTLQQNVRELQTSNQLMRTQLDRLLGIVVRDSTNLSSLLYETVFNLEFTANSGTETLSDPFDVSKSQRDALGNPVYPHAFYIVSAFTPTVGRNVVFNGTLIVGSDISVAIKRVFSTGPDRFESFVSVYNVGADTPINVKVLRLLGVR